MNTPAMFKATELLALERQIATEHCRVAIECFARSTPSSFPMPIYDVSQQEENTCTEPEILEANRLEVERAVKYLDMRELLMRPVPSMPQYVAFKPGKPS